MKHRILIEFSADTLPDDFLDQIAGRVYGHPAVDKKECTATLLEMDKPVMVWECNECGSQEYTMCVSESDVQELGCGNCGGDEWHRAPYRCAAKDTQ